MLINGRWGIWLVVDRWLSAVHRRPMTAKAGRKEALASKAPALKNETPACSILAEEKMVGG